MSAETETLHALRARLDTHGVRRITLEVDGELVTLMQREGRLQMACTCAAEACEHAHLAQTFFAGVSAPPEPQGQPASSELAAHKLRSSLRPPPLAHVDATAMADAFDALCLATARAGANLQDSPSLHSAMEQLVASATQPVSLSLARFIGRFNAALAMGEVGKVARLLAGAQSWAHEIKRGDRSRESAARTRVWLGLSEGEAPASLTDVMLLEVGREWLTGLTRSAIERRYLVDLASGALYSEERRRGEQDISVGPCPRVVHAAFAELETAVAPPRARLLQYTVTHEPSDLQWQRLSELGESELSVLSERYAEAAQRCPGLSEPAVLFAASELSPGSTGALRDVRGTRLELRDDSDTPLADMVRGLCAEGELVWVLGRLKGVARGLVLRPVSVLLRVDGRLRLRRIT